MENKKNVIDENMDHITLNHLIDELCQYYAYTTVLSAEKTKLLDKKDLAHKDGLRFLELKYGNEFDSVRKELQLSQEKQDEIQSAFWSSLNGLSLQRLDNVKDYAHEKLVRMRRSDRTLGKIGLAKGYYNVIGSARVAKSTSRMTDVFDKLSLYEKFSEFVQRCAIVQSNALTRTDFESLGDVMILRAQYGDIEQMSEILTKLFNKHMSSDDSKKKLRSALSSDKIRLDLTEKQLKHKDEEGLESVSIIDEWIKRTERADAEEEIALLRMKNEIVKNYLLTGNVLSPSLEGIMRNIAISSDEVHNINE